MYVFYFYLTKEVFVFSKAHVAMNTTLGMSRCVYVLYVCLVVKIYAIHFVTRTVLSHRIAAAATAAAARIEKKEI